MRSKFRQSAKLEKGKLEGGEGEKYNFLVIFILKKSRARKWLLVRDKGITREGITSDSLRRVWRLSMTVAISAHSFSASWTTVSATSDNILGGDGLVPVSTDSRRSIDDRRWIGESGFVYGLGDTPLGPLDATGSPVSLSSCTDGRLWSCDMNHEGLMGDMMLSASRPRSLPLLGSCNDLGRVPGKGAPNPFLDECRLVLRSLLLPRRMRSMSSTCLCRTSMLDVRTLAPPSLSARSVNRWTSTSRLSWVTSSAETSERESVSSVPVSLTLSSSASADSTSIVTGPEFSRWTES